tara:strand:- start:4583 stop:4777 length:195 start_codon:yes stop_codon:yes gene_type:complete
VWSEFFDEIFTVSALQYAGSAGLDLFAVKEQKISYIFLLFSLKYAYHLEDQTASFFKFIFFLCN